MSKKLRESRLKTLFVFILVSSFLIHSNAAYSSSQIDETIPEINIEHASSLVNYWFRINMEELNRSIHYPLKILRKLSRKNAFAGQNADQVLLGMMAFPHEWQSVPMIKTSHPQLKEFLGTDSKLIAFNQITGSE